MNWIALAVVAQCINAVVAVVDKHIISDEKMFPRPFVYAFYTCLIAGGWVVVYFISLVIPFSVPGLPSFDNVHRPTLEVVALSVFAAYTFFTALVSLFTALREGHASDVVPVVGATSAVVSFGASYFFFHTQLPPNFVYGIILLSAGTYLVSRFHFSWKTALVTLHSGVFFALHYIAMKGLSEVSHFDDGFFWSRIALMLYALSLLMVPTFFEKITEQTKKTTRHAGFLILVNKLLAGIAALLILKANSLGDVAVVQALGGLQYVFILIIGVFFTWSPRSHVLGEVYHSDTILQKALFVSIITAGFIVLFV